MNYQLAWTSLRAKTLGVPSHGVGSRDDTQFVGDLPPEAQLGSHIREKASLASCRGRVK